MFVVLNCLIAYIRSVPITTTGLCRDCLPLSAFHSLSDLSMSESGGH